MVYTSLNGHPSLGGEVEFFTDFVNWPAGQLHASVRGVKLNFNVLLDNFCFSVEQDD